MKKENIETLKKEIITQILMFERKLFLCDIKPSQKITEMKENVKGMVDLFLDRGLDDFDLWVFLKYREGKLRSKNSRLIEQKPKTLVEALEEGFEIPDDATMVEFKIKPVLEKNYNRIVNEESLYTIKFGLGKGEELTVEQLKRRYGLNPNDNLFSIDDMKESKILKIYNRKKRLKEERKKAQEQVSSSDV